MPKGSCLCGGVRFEVTGPLRAMARCHCDQCRKASGAEFATNASIAVEHFELTSGAELLCEYESSPGQARVFCGRCGSPVMKRNAANPGKIRLRLGLIEGELEQRPFGHVFVSEKPGWSEIHDDLPQFDTVPVAPSN